MSIERRFDVPFVSALSLREKAIQQTYRPVIAVHKWFARRPGALFRALMLSEFVDEDLRTSYFRSHELPDTHVADPFMGGGTPLMEANRMGASVSGWDINPMAWWIVGRKLERIDPNTYAQAATALTEALREQVGDLYETECPECKGTALVKYFFWVKVQPCHRCRRPIDLFPGYLVAARGRHPRHVLVCSKCGDLNETSDRRSPGACSGCREALTIQGPARKGLVSCAHCGAANKFPDPSAGPLGHRMFAIEYHCFACKARRNGRLPARRGRFFKKPSARDLAKYEHAAERWQHMTAEFVPDDSVPPGDESTRLHRWGYRRYRQMFNARQLLGLELSARLVAAQPDRALHRALATNLSDLLRYNNLLVRYDTVSLKALDLFSVHGFPVGLVRCEANLLGIRAPNGRPVGSGGWANIVDKYRTAKEYCARPFEVAAGSRAKVFMTGEWIGEGTQEDGSAHDGVGPKVADLRCGDAAQAQLAPHSLDAVFTDPPYFDSVQYAELMDFCYVWLRRVTRSHEPAFAASSTRNPAELTGNDTEGRTLEHFTEGLAAVYRQMAIGLKPGAPLAFTYHHNRGEAYHPVAVAILDAGLAVTASLPCPAEMGGSIHISGTRSSIVDTVFVCRALKRSPAAGDPSVAQAVAADLHALRTGGVKPTEGDARCIAFGHMTRLTVQSLRPSWDASASVRSKLAKVANSMRRQGCVDAVIDQVYSVKQGSGRAVQSDLLEGVGSEERAVAI